MATVQLRDIVTEADKAAVLELRRAPGQERFLGSMISHFEDAVTRREGVSRMWSVHDGDQLVGFVMISDGIPAETLAADDDIVGPYYLWRLLIDEALPGPRLRRGDDRRGRGLPADPTRCRRPPDELRPRR